MRRSIVFIATFMIGVILWACTANEIYYPVKGEIVDSDNITDSWPNVQYEYDEISVDNSLDRQTAFISRGIAFVGRNTIAYVYNPISDTLNPLCSDPICQHGISSEECIFRWLWRGSSLNCYSNRLYFSDSPLRLTPDDPYEYRIISTDIYGQNGRTIYSTSNQLYLPKPTDEGIYFVHTLSDKQMILCRIDYQGNKYITLDIPPNDAMCVESYFVLDDCILFTTSDLKLYRCSLDLREVECINTKLAGDFYINYTSKQLFINNSKSIYLIDTQTGNLHPVLSAPERMRFINVFMDDNCLYYQLISEEYNYLNYRVYTKQMMEKENTIFYYNYYTGETDKCCILPSEFMIAGSLDALAHNGYLYCKRVEERPGGTDDPSMQTMQITDTYIVNISTGDYKKIG